MAQTLSRGYLEKLELENDANNGLDLKNLSLTDILDLNDLQTLQDAFAKANRAASTITDIHGEPITQPSNHCEVCRLIRETPKGLQNCKRSGEALGKISFDTNQPNFHRCFSVGFIDAAAPIVIGGVHMANWLIGQNCAGDVDDGRIMEYAAEIGVDQTRMLHAFHDMQVISESAFQEKLDFLWLMANQLSALAYQNLKYKYTVQSLSLSKQALKDYQNQLETRIEARTTSLKTANQQLKMEIQERKAIEIERSALIADLQQALGEVKKLSGLLPICSHCKRIRDDQGYWNQIESYIQSRSDAKFSHGICKECAEKYYPDIKLYED